ncbi:hypothetical protein BHF71_09280 [Vulcanibacillus modesticaldus]|uniref:CBS domain-containing protein n=1 Tax=Vulcanibacillus modesticaldus TaxID=337097 RepID=A0A1D2YUC7_9BACI|nr:CBS domain-containing protein [Vulcanibacillus modesticaldus]OEF99261.1 hypothetical protein BHF71_09280 [Vulcanibacillus modesticaldus]
MRNSDRFLIAFNAIEKYLKEYAPNEHYLPFSKLLHYAKKSNPVVRTFYEDLKEFSELRNAIVHDTFDSSFAIAEPHDKIVEKIEQIEREISQPVKVIPLFQKKVTFFQADDTFIDILRVINKHSYSKFPIYKNGKLIGLLTKKGIVNWMAKNVDLIDTIVFSKITLEELLFHEKKQKNFLFIHKEMNVYDIKEIYKNNLEKDSTRLSALLITENGKPEESLLGIITPTDLIKIH